MKNIVFILISISALSIYVAFFSSGTFLGFDDTQQNQITLMSGVSYAVLMVFGILAGQAHSMLGDPSMKIGRGFVRALFESNELWKSLLAAPIIFGAVYSMLSETSDIILASIFSFQNGFFCNSVLESKRISNEEA
ncbi:hypothetical protein [Pseudoalteromonas luteoviolacea]|uniref:Uncharacterized protein n=1 Tax=Pseudoalteromonas luteoviolacea DSM 6061 TaxID=1365250 RepID=A0A166VHQ2_9GAMM|nr:hypothetical protein [Pseudoalteromonas luteoviolacea]KZN32889.1 hypothetical protein N475_20430 [Pseudoalteromonas luteoviolacea DSM 6061]MBE0385396.1 hypothetical protein [Pseudoalteromonas luteoviolacea DSM 6061]